MMRNFEQALEHDRKEKYVQNTENMRKNLIRLLMETGVTMFPHNVANHLLKNNVTVLPCKTGDTVYYIDSWQDIKPLEVIQVEINGYGVFVKAYDGSTFTHIAPCDDFFYSEEEAEKELARRKEKEKVKGDI